MTFDNMKELKRALWDIEPPTEIQTHIGACEDCGEKIYEEYEYLETDDRDKFCDENCFISHAFNNYLHKKSKD